MTAALAIPAWEQTELSSLASAGDLSGVPATVLGAVDQAESSGQGGGVNATGYGGWFGLAATTTYQGHILAPTMLAATTSGAFAAQAVTAAATWSSDLGAAGGTPFAAEQIYQTGQPTGFGEGDKVLAGVIGTTKAKAKSTAVAGWVTWVSPATGGILGIGNAVSGGQITAAPGSVVKKGVSALGSAALSSWGPFLSKGLLIAAGAALVVVSVVKAADPHLSSQVADAGKTAALAGAAA